MSLSFTSTGSLLTPEQLATLAATYEQGFPALRERPFSVEIGEATAEEIAALNQEHRHKPEPTDVLSFPLFPNLEAAAQHPVEPILLGSIVYAPDVASNLGEHPADLVHHGLLHLLGFDHEADLTTWRKVERAIIQEALDRQLPLNHLP